MKQTTPSFLHLLCEKGIFFGNDLKNYERYLKYALDKNIRQLVFKFSLLTEYGTRYECMDADEVKPIYFYMDA